MTKTTINRLLIAVFVIGVGVIGVAGYQYFDTKAEGKAAQQEADNLLKHRTIDTKKQKGELLSKWKAKKKFEKKGIRKGKVMGKLLIPKLKAELPIVEGVDPNDLAKGVGHVSGTKLPLDNGQTVLSGHRDTVFKGIGRLKVGDKLTVSLPYGDFSYKITKTYVVDAKDRTVIVPHDHEVLTVTTCYPFNFIGNAPDRYIIQAKPTFDMKQLQAEKAAEKAYQQIMSNKNEK